MKKSHQSSQEEAEATADDEEYATAVDTSLDEDKEEVSTSTKDEGQSKENIMSLIYC